MHPFTWLMAVTCLILTSATAYAQWDDPPSGADAGDTFVSATPLLPGTYAGTSGGNLEVNGSDYYRISVPDQGTLAYTLQLTSGNYHPYNASFYDPAGTLLAGPTDLVAGGPPFAGTWQGLAGGDYVVSFVSAGGGIGAVKYDIVVAVTEASSDDDGKVCGLLGIEPVFMFGLVVLYRRFRRRNG